MPETLTFWVFAQGLKEKDFELAAGEVPGSSYGPEQICQPCTQTNIKPVRERQVVAANEASQEAFLGELYKILDKRAGVKDIKDITLLAH